MVVHMSNYKWCHGTDCHTHQTQDRVRGSKGSKVLRTRKVRQNTDSQWYEQYAIYNYFCSQGCLMDFIKTHMQRIVALDPRHEALETPINDPKKTVHTSDYTYSDGTRHSWTTTEIEKRGVDTITE
mgnify:FL=1|jgi:hypothetical protein